MHIPNNAHDVNGQRTNNSQGGIGHNGGPDLYVREIGKLQAIDAVLRDKRYSQTEALILIGLIVRSDNSYDNAFPGATTLAVYAKVKRRDTVFAALQNLEDEHKVIQRQNRGSGRSNSYRVLPQQVVEAIVAEYDKRREKSSTAETDGFEAGSTAKPDGSKNEPVRFNRTARPSGRPVEQDATRPVEADATRPVEPDTIHSLSIPVTNPVAPPIFVPVNMSPVDSYEVDRVRFENGKLELLNGLRAYWLEQFDNDAKRLNLALIEAAHDVNTNSRKPIEAQIGKTLARIAGQKVDSDKRYQRATERKQSEQAPKPKTTKPWMIRHG